MLYTCCISVHLEKIYINFYKLDWANLGANISPDTPSPTPRASIQYIWVIPVFLGGPASYGENYETSKALGLDIIFVCIAKLYPQTAGVLESHTFLNLPTEN